MVHQHHILEFDVGVHETLGFHKVQGSDQLKHAQINTLPLSLLHEVPQTIVQLFEHDAAVPTLKETFVEVDDVVAGPKFTQSISLAMDETDSDRSIRELIVGCG